MSYRSRISIVVKNNFAWVWYSFLYYINPSFTNHLKFRWYHYKFCQRRGEVFLVQLYLGQWRAYIENMLVKHPENIIPSHGLQAILEMIKENKIEKLLSFLESQNMETGMATFLKDLNTLNNIDPLTITILPQLNHGHNSDINDGTNKSREITRSEDNNTELAIHGRTWVIALHIHYQIFFSEEAYGELTYSRARYMEVIKALFRVDQNKI